MIQPDLIRSFESHNFRFNAALPVYIDKLINYLGLSKVGSLGGAKHKRSLMLSQRRRLINVTSRCSRPASTSRGG
jgi:hypothetical protein